MLITKISELSGVEHTMDIPVTQAQIDHWQEQKRIGGPQRHIQNALPDLTADQREFLMTGITPEEWEATFGGEDDDG